MVGKETSYKRLMDNTDKRYNPCKQDNSASLRNAMVSLYGRMMRDMSLIPSTDEKIVKVPEMAESITEGTLKQWSKRKIAHTISEHEHEKGH